MNYIIKYFNKKGDHFEMVSYYYCSESQFYRHWHLFNDDAPLGLEVIKEKLNGEWVLNVIITID